MVEGMVTTRAVKIPQAGDVVTDCDLAVPGNPRGVVVFAHGSGSSRHSPRNRQVATRLQAGGQATLLLDLLTAAEEQVDLRTRHLRFDVELLARRLATAAAWVGDQRDLAGLPIGYFGASTGAAAALIAAADHPDGVAAVVSRGGRLGCRSLALPLSPCAAPTSRPRRPTPAGEEEVQAAGRRASSSRRRPSICSASRSSFWTVRSAMRRSRPSR